MKTTGYILLVTILMLQSGGLGLIYSMMESKVQYEMLGKVAKKETRFQTIRLTLEEFKKRKINAGEIFYQGNMYDIKSVKIENNIAELLVLNDTKEKNICEHIQSLNENNSKSDNNDQTFQLIKLITLPFICHTNDVAMLFQESGVTVFFSYSENMVSSYSKIPSPPPKSV